MHHVYIAIKEFMGAKINFDCRKLTQSFNLPTALSVGPKSAVSLAEG